jgi:hyperosmotically inducible protein
MNRKIVSTALVFGALILPAAAFSAESGQDQDRSSARAFVKDSVITAKIKSQMAKDKQVSALHIKVDTDDHGVVQLSGTARSQGEADRAVEIAKAVEGVVLVQSEIRVNPNR